MKVLIALLEEGEEVEGMEVLEGIGVFDNADKFVWEEGDISILCAHCQARPVAGSRKYCGNRCMKAAGRRAYYLRHGR